MKRRWPCDSTTTEESGVGQQMCFLWYRSAIQNTELPWYNYNFGTSDSKCLRHPCNWKEGYDFFSFFEVEINHLGNFILIRYDVQSLLYLIKDFKNHMDVIYPVFPTCYLNPAKKKKVAKLYLDSHWCLNSLICQRDSIS